MGAFCFMREVNSQGLNGRGSKVRFVVVAARLLEIKSVLHEHTHRMVTVRDALFQEVHDHSTFVKRPRRVVVVQAKRWNEPLRRQLQELFRFLVRVDLHFTAELDVHQLPIWPRSNGLTVLVNVHTTTMLSFRTQE